MQIKKVLIIVFCLNISINHFFAQPPLTALYNSLDPLSLSQQLAFYELYADTSLGSQIKNRIVQSLAFSSEELFTHLPALVNRDIGKVLSDQEVALIENLSQNLCNRNLKGYFVESENEVLKLPSEEVDLGKALLLSQFEGEENVTVQAQIYSAWLDLMALQMKMRLSKDATDEDKIQEMNRFIFEEMHFRFPPHSLYAQDIDLYTFLPSVMDNHLGVCLGVTALYLALAQRIGLSLEIITPPGHIYLRYRNEKKVINIETTARGIDPPEDTYLGVSTPSLQKRSIKEVVGLTHVNQASTFLQAGQYEKAARAYEKALPYLPNDSLVLELLGYCYFFLDKKERGLELLNQAWTTSSQDFTTSTFLVDFINHDVNLEGIEAILSSVDETRYSIVKKQQKILDVLKKFPRFREGLNQLAVTWIQLNRAKEAIEVLKRYHSIDSSNPVIEYYLAVLLAERNDYKQAWYHLKNAESIVAKKHFMPKVLKTLREELSALSPPPK